MNVHTTGNTIEKKLRACTKRHIIYDDELDDLLNSENAKWYAATSTDPDQYVVILTHLSSILQANQGEPLMCMNVIGALSYPAVQQLTRRFSSEKNVREAVSAVVTQSLEHLFYDTTDITQKDLTRHLGTIQRYLRFISNDEMYDSVGRDIAQTIENIQADDGDTRWVNLTVKKLKQKCTFLKEHKPAVYTRVRKDVQRNYADIAQRIL